MLEKMCKITLIVAAILCCLVLSFGTVAAQLPESDANNITASKDQISYRLPNDTRPETYEISLRTSKSFRNGHFDYEGSVGINILIMNATRGVTIHARELKIKQIRLSNDSNTIDLLPWRSNNITDFLIIPTKTVKLLQGDRYRLDIEFSGVLRDDSLGFFHAVTDSCPSRVPHSPIRDYAATNFDPIYARTAFPCYDEPSFKASVTIEIAHGANYFAYSNMAATRWEYPDGTVTTRFATTPLISTHLIHFVVAESDLITNGANSKSPMPVLGVGFLCHPNMRDVNLSLPHEGDKAIETLESYLRVPKMKQMFSVISAQETYEFSKYYIHCPNYQGILSSFPRQVPFVGLTTKKVSNQWFGNIAKWWSSIWLSKGLSGLLKIVAVDLVYPIYDVFNTFNIILQNSFMSDVDPLTPPLVRYVEDPKSIHDMVMDRNTILKSTSVIRMIWEALTPASFNKGLATYLAINAAGDEDDLFDALDRVAKEDSTLGSNVSVKEIFSSWSHQAGYPILTVTRNYDNGSITISQERYTTDKSTNLTNATTWWIPYNFATAKSLSFNDKRPDGWLPQHQRSKLIQPSGNRSWAASEWVLFNKQQTGYYRVMYDIRNWKLLIAELHMGPNNTIHPRNRGQLLDDLLSFVKSGRLPRDLLLDMVKYLKYEKDYLPWIAGLKALNYLLATFPPTEDRTSFLKTIGSICGSAMERMEVKSWENWDKWLNWRKNKSAERPNKIDNLFPPDYTLLCWVSFKQDNYELDGTVHIPHNLFGDIEFAWIN